MNWGQIVEEYSSMVWRTITRFVPDTTDAADCFQATFVGAWELSKRQPIRNWPALLCRIATARALERGRQLTRQRSRFDAFPVEGVIDLRHRDPLANAQAAELDELLKSALTEIDPREAEVFCLACLDEFSYRDIALQLGLTTNHVGVLLTRARGKLRSRLASFFEDHTGSTKGARQ